MGKESFDNSQLLEQNNLKEIGEELNGGNGEHLTLVDAGAQKTGITDDVPEEIEEDELDDKIALELHQKLQREENTDGVYPASESTTNDPIEDQAAHEAELRKDVESALAGLNNDEILRYLGEMPEETADDIYRKTLVMELIAKRKNDGEARTEDSPFDLSDIDDTQKLPILDEETIAKIESTKGLDLETEQAEADVILAQAAEAEAGNQQEAEPVLNHQPELVKRFEMTDQERFLLNESLLEVGITLNDLEAMDGFTDDLSVGQRFRVVENLKYLTLEKASEAADNEFEETNAVLDSQIQTTKQQADTVGKKVRSAPTLLGQSMKRGWRDVMRSAYIGAAEKRHLNELRKPGVSDQIKLAQGQIDIQREGPDVIRNESTGLLETQYLNITPDMDESETAEATAFNAASNALAQIPSAWATAKPSSSERQQYDQAKAIFEAQKTQAINTLCSELGIQAGNLRFSGIEADIENSQAIHTHPDIEAQLDSVSNASKLAIGYKGFKNMDKLRGAYMVTGAATKWAINSATGYVVAPLLSSIQGYALGGKMSANRQMKKRLERAGRGIEDTSNTSIKNMIDAPKATEKIDRLLEKIQTEEDPAEQQKIAAFLRARIENTNEKIDAGYVNFGSVDERNPAHYQLRKSLAAAEASLLSVPGTAENLVLQNRVADLYNNEHQDKITRRLDRINTSTQAELAERQKTFIAEQRLAQAKSAFKFGLLGAALSGAGQNVFASSSEAPSGEGGAVPIGETSNIPPPPEQSGMYVPENVEAPKEPFNVMANLEAQEAQGAAEVAVKPANGGQGFEVTPEELDDFGSDTELGYAYETIDDVEPYMTDEAKAEWVENRVEQYRSEGHPVAKSVGLVEAQAQRDWLTIRNASLQSDVAEALNLDSSNGSFSVQSRTFNIGNSGPQPIPPELQMKYFGNVLGETDASTAPTSIEEMAERSRAGDSVVAEGEQTPDTTPYTEARTRWIQDYLLQNGGEAAYEDAVTAWEELPQKPMGPDVAAEGSAPAIDAIQENNYQTVQEMHAEEIGAPVPEEPIGPPAPEYEIKPVEVAASEKGAIQTFVDLKEQLRAEYSDEASRPPVVQELLNEDAIKLAEKYGFYNPGGAEESSMILKGETLRIGENGALEYAKTNGEIITLEDGQDFSSVEGQWGDKGGTMFDYDGGTQSPDAVVSGGEAEPTITAESIAQAWKEPGTIDPNKQYTTLPYIDPFMTMAEKQSWVNEFVEKALAEGRSTEDIINAPQEWIALRDERMANDLGFKPDTNYQIDDIGRTYQNLDAGGEPEPIPEPLQMKYFGNVLVETETPEPFAGALEPGSVEYTERVGEVNTAMDEALKNGTVLTEDAVMRGRLRVVNYDEFMSLEEKVDWVRERALAYVDVYEPGVEPGHLIEHAEHDLRELQQSSIMQEMGITKETLKAPLDVHERTINGEKISSGLQMKYFGNISGGDSGIEATTTETTPTILTQAEIDEYEKISPGFAKEYQESLDEGAK